MARKRQRHAAPARPRERAAVALARVLGEGRSLGGVLEEALSGLEGPDRGLAQALCYGTLRWYPRLQPLLGKLLHRPLKGHDRELEALLLIGLYQLTQMGTPPHAAVAETVGAAAGLGKDWARGLVNAVLRNAQRRAVPLAQALDAEPETRTAHPRWLLERLQQAWPQDWEAIVAANNRQAPMTLRVNLRRGGREAYLEQLAAAGLAARPAPHTQAGVILEEAVAVERLPGFAQGAVSVQDAAAQLAAQLLAPAAGDHILDACAAPGGKTAHLLETASGPASVDALDRDPGRLGQVRDTLDRLGLEAAVRAGDAAEPAHWWDGRAYDRILLDAPCTATGVIRRHPDIKLLRRATDVAGLAAQQQRLLDAVWPLLKPGGMLLYATCSVLPEENTQQVLGFLDRHADARLAPIPGEWGRETAAGRQVLPGEDDMDGFFYAALLKR